MSAYQKGLALIKEYGWKAFIPSREGIALGVTTKYPVLTHHLPSVETVIVGIPASSAVLYGVTPILSPNMRTSAKLL